MKLNQIRTKFLEYFKNNNHQIVKSSPLIPHNDPSLMFTSAGMVQFKNYFTGASTPPYLNATSSQKCVRAGGKHNDLENVGYTSRHHTFFEMMGNFSFGNYFKEEAINFAWDFLTREVGLNKDKLYFTVYHNDDESFNLWHKLGINKERIIRINSSDNFWAMGDTGPCGPCTEIFYDHGDKIFGGLPGTANENGDRYIEIWNIVFMQYEQLASGERINLPKPCVDTGMGIERFAAVMQGVSDNYQIDLFQNLISNISDLAQIKVDGNNINSFKVLADHLRSISFLIADGVFPSNEGRGYVLRRIIRRAMRHLNLIGFENKTLINQMVPVISNLMGDHYHELKQAESTIIDTIYNEEQKFISTLDKGIKLLNHELKTLSNKQFPGEIAFKLYDTYGFPLDLTIDILRQHKITLEHKGFEQAMAEQKSKARASWQGSGETASNKIWLELYDKLGATEFLGYQLEQAEANIIALVDENNNLIDNLENYSGKYIWIITNQTPFYGESGGQMGDQGIIKNKNFFAHIIDTQKFTGKIIAHKSTKFEGKLHINNSVTLTINSERRNKLRANHSATHLLHKSLRKILGEHVVQKGSLVAEDKLRFDFSNNQPLTLEQIQQIELIVNQQIINNKPIITKLMDAEEAIENGAMALFGEKYDDEVRVLFMGEEPENNQYFSIELCGGTHVKATGDIGCFKITAESSVASGIRRIEALTGLEAINFSQQQQQEIIDIAYKLKLNNPKMISASIEQLQTNYKQAQNHLSQLQQQLLESHKASNNYYSLVVNNFDNKIIKKWLESSNNKHNLAVVINKIADKINLLVVSKYDKINAKNFATMLTEILGGKGCGGNANFAQGGMANNNKINELDKIIDTILREHFTTNLQ